MSKPVVAATGAARSRLAARESFFGGPLSTREASKAPGWKAFIKPAPQPEAAPAGKPKGGRSASGASKPRAQQPTAPPPDPGVERRQKLRQRRDFSGLDDDAPPPPPAAQRPAAAKQQHGVLARQQQTAAGPPPRQQQHQQLNNQQKVTKRGVAGGGKKAVAGRGMALEVTAVGKARKQVASDALRQRVGEMVAHHAEAAAGSGRAAAAADLGSPSGSGVARGGAGGVAAAAVAARAARDAANTKAVMQKQQFRTAHGMQTLQLVSRAPGAGRGGAGAGGGTALAAMRAGAATSPGARPGAASPGSVSKGAPRPVTGAGAPRRLQQQQQQGQGAPQFRGAFYGGHQPPAALEGRMRFNKRRLSMDSQQGGSDLDSFIASDEEEGEAWESDGAGGEGGWRAALREATGGYDPTKFAHIDRLPDRGMEVGWNEISAEEKRTLRIARTEDEREAEAEARQEAAKRERKEKRKRGVAAFLDDD
ncbi:SPT2-like protein [Micractinium conductrix]|uniref:SPT2-like protein n=1 Tax=Micractinium conductrix TaxID=554055 RepID=A0A2P6V6S2_9CHLO|nr:SPT2-like protein [Micractinium conductrix]|eukprot:PSC69779.1 SPT2-like protein [Micractinium conductrix]